MKKVLVISTSPRHNSNSDALADEFIRGAKEAGNGGNICIIKDDMSQIIQKMHDADVICWATPIYYYEMSAQMKVIIDRGNPLYTSAYHFRDIYMLTSAAEDEPEVPQRAIAGLTGWIDCFENATLKGTVFAGGVNDPGDIKNHPSLLKAYEMGKNC